jgi:hypothetical protein
MSLYICFQDQVLLWFPQTFLGLRLCFSTLHLSLALSLSLSLCICLSKILEWKRIVKERGLYRDYILHVWMSLSTSKYQASPVRRHITLLLTLESQNGLIDMRALYIFCFTLSFPRHCHTVKAKQISVPLS